MATITIDTSGAIPPTYDQKTGRINSAPCGVADSIDANAISFNTGPVSRSIIAANYVGSDAAIIRIFNYSDELVIIDQGVTTTETYTTQLTDVGGTPITVFPHEITVTSQDMADIGVRFTLQGDFPRCKLPEEVRPTLTRTKGFEFEVEDVNGQVGPRNFFYFSTEHITPLGG